MVPRRGDAPRSSGYQPGALLLSYRGVQFYDLASSQAGNFDKNCTLDAFMGRSGFRDRFLVCAGRAPFEKWVWRPLDGPYRPDEPNELQMKSTPART